MAAYWQELSEDFQARDLMLQSQAWTPIVRISREAQPSARRSSGRRRPADASASRSRSQDVTEVGLRTAQVRRPCCAPRWPRTRHRGVEELTNIHYDCRQKPTLASLHPWERLMFEWQQRRANAPRIALMLRMNSEQLEQSCSTPVATWTRQPAVVARREKASNIQAAVRQLVQFKAGRRGAGAAVRRAFAEAAVPPGTLCRDSGASMEAIKAAVSPSTRSKSRTRSRRGQPWILRRPGRAS